MLEHILLGILEKGQGSLERGSHALELEILGRGNQVLVLGIRERGILQGNQELDDQALGPDEELEHSQVLEELDSREEIR